MSNYSIPRKVWNDTTPVVGEERGLSRDLAIENDILFLDAREAYRLIEAAVDEKGEEHSVSTGGCVYYFAPDAGHSYVEPSCIVGVGLDLYAIDLERAFGDEHRDERLAGIIRDGSTLDEQVIMTEAAKDILAVAQSVQDDGSDWGVALDRARNFAIQQGFLWYDEG